MDSTVLRLLFLTVLLLSIISSETAEIKSDSELSISSAQLTYEYRDNKNGLIKQGTTYNGRYARDSILESITGQLIHVQTDDGLNHGCTPILNVPKTKTTWIALVQRGLCRFEHKVINTVLLSNASAVIVYNNMVDEPLVTMEHGGK